MVIEVNWRKFVEEFSGFYSVLWVWFHLFLIYMYGVVRVGEPNRVIITVELFVSTVFVVLWIVRFVGFLKAK